MPRKPRLILENASYHVYNQINNHRSLNLVDDTYDMFKTLLHDLKTQFNIDIYAYCLMTNHYHIELKTKQANIDKAMNYFGFYYARYINAQTNASGPVFRGRYKAKLIENDSYFLQVLRYIHLNPVEAKLCNQFDTYEWSSIQDYLEHNNNIINCNEILSKFISTNDFMHYHERGNTEKLQQFYQKKRTPNIISDNTVL